MVIGLTRGAAGNSGNAEDLGHAGHHRPGRGHDPAHVRHRRRRGAAQADRPAFRRAGPAAHPPSPARPGLEPLAGPLPAGCGLPDHGGGGYGGHDLPPRRPGLDHRHDTDRADDPPSPVRLRGVRAGEKSDRRAAAVLRGSRRRGLRTAWVWPAGQRTARTRPPRSIERCPPCGL